MQVYGEITVRGGEQVVRVAVRGQKFNTVMAAIGGSYYDAQGLLLMVHACWSGLLVCAHGEGCAGWEEAGKWSERRRELLLAQHQLVHPACPGAGSHPATIPVTLDFQRCE
jgi:hypothetical protein